LAGRMYNTEFTDELAGKEGEPLHGGLLAGVT
jgi:hypothetical protein